MALTGHQRGLLLANRTEDEEEWEGEDDGAERERGDCEGGCAVHWRVAFVEACCCECAVDIPTHQSRPVAFLWIGG